MTDETIYDSSDEQDIDFAEVARVIFQACFGRFTEPEQCYPAVSALFEAGYLREP